MPDPTDKRAICHYVRHDGEGDYEAVYTRIRAVCGAECLLDHDGEPIPDDFNFVLAPDPNKITDCLRCLEWLAGHTNDQESVGATGGASWLETMR